MRENLVFPHMQLCTHMQQRTEKDLEVNTLFENIDKKLWDTIL